MSIVNYLFAWYDCYDDCSWTMFLTYALKLGDLCMFIPDMQK